MKIEILNDIAVSENFDNNDYSKACAYPLTTLTERGKLITVYRIGKEKLSYDGIWLCQTSEDNGQSWAKPVTIFDSLQSKPVVSVASGGICQIPNGPLVTSFFAIEVTTDKYCHSEEGHAQFTRVYTSQSSDDGSTWSLPNLIMRKQAHGVTTSPLYTHDGKLMMPLENKADVLIGFSGDYGKTCSEFKRCMLDPNDKLKHCDVRFTVFPDGQIMALLWTFQQSDEQTLQVHRSVSGDNGKSWSTPEPVGFLGQIATPLAINSDTVIAAANYRQQPNGIKLWISHDRGITWKNPPIQMWDPKEEKIIGQPMHTSNDSGKNDGVWDALQTFSFGTPDLTNLNDGTIVLTYYATKNKIIHIRACRFKLIL